MYSGTLKSKVAATMAVALAVAATPANSDDTAAPRNNQPIIVALADDKEEAAPQLPDGAAGFDGQVVGVVEKKEENRVFFRVVRVEKVWPNANKADKPDALNGKTIIIRAANARAEFHQRFISKMAVGDDYRLNIKHGEQAVFLITELTAEQRELAGVANDKPKDKPSDKPNEKPNEKPRDESTAADEQVDKTKAPPGLHGFSGQIVGRLASKDTEKGELTLEIYEVQRVWRNNKAKSPKSAVGRTLKIEGVFGKFLDVLLTLKKGDGVQIETKHASGDNLNFLGEGLSKVELPARREEPKQETPKRETPKNETPKNDQPKEATSRAGSLEPTAGELEGLQGFRGILIGTLVGKDVEAGTMVFKMDRVKRVWKQNEAKNPELSKGKNLLVKGVSGKFLDVLLVLKPGDTIEVEAFHTSGTHLDFPGEWLKKVE